jgi:hypothetical protein
MSCRTLYRRSVCAVMFTAAMAVPVFGQTVSNPPSFDFVTIGAVNNPAYQGTPGDPVAAANARTELTHAQYVPFINVLATRPTSPVSNFVNNTAGLRNGPSAVGMRTDLNYGGPGFRFEVAPGAENWPIIGLSWRLAAMYCNWMHNGMQDDPQSMTSGAYDISTFNNPDSSLRWTDQLTKSPGARFWIPTLDEWVKGAHYDPNRNGQAHGGYWLYPTSRDTPPLVGLPSEGGQFFSAVSERNPVGMYPTFASPWGLLDAAGDGAEWTEGTRTPQGTNTVLRILEGGSMFSTGTSTGLDINGGAVPFANSFATLRIATVPCSSSAIVTLMLLKRFSQRRR